MKNMPPQMRTYTVVSPTASAGACISTDRGWAKAIRPAKSTAQIRPNTTTEPPMREPISSGFRSPRYRAMSTVMPMASWVRTKVTRLRIWLPVDTADRPEVEPNRPTTRRSTAP